MTWLMVFSENNFVAGFFKVCPLSELTHEDWVFFKKFYGFDNLSLRYLSEYESQRIFTLGEIPYDEDLIIC